MGNTLTKQTQKTPLASEEYSSEFKTRFPGLFKSDKIQSTTTTIGVVYHSSVPVTTYHGSDSITTIGVVYHGYVSEKGLTVAHHDSVLKTPHNDTAAIYGDDSEIDYSNVMSPYGTTIIHDVFGNKICKSVKMIPRKQKSAYLRQSEFMAFILENYCKTEGHSH